MNRRSQRSLFEFDPWEDDDFIDVKCPACGRTESFIGPWGHHRAGEKLSNQDGSWEIAWVCKKCGNRVSVRLEPPKR